jgi:hypothetical protein
MVGKIERHKGYREKSFVADFLGKDNKDKIFCLKKR